MSARPSALERPDITLPDGRVFAPVDRLAQEALLHPRTIKRKIKVIYIGGCAYAERGSTLLSLVGEQAPAKRRTRATKPHMQAAE